MQINECLSASGKVIDYGKYYKVRGKLLESLQSSLYKCRGIKARALIIKALLSKNTIIIPTELERDDYGADVGYIVSIDYKSKLGQREK